MKIVRHERDAVGKLSDRLALGCIIVGLLIGICSFYGFLK
jgi:hypothetical protein